MSTVDDLTIAFEDDGIELCKEIDKAVLSKGAWATVIFKYQDWNSSKGEYDQPKMSLRRYRKIKGQYKQQSKFNISSMKQARALTSVLQDWTAE